MKFFERPREVWLRKALFQVHLWLGVGLGVYFTLVSLTGAAIVYKKEIERAMIPRLVRVEAPAGAAGQRQSFQAMVDRVKATYPGLSLSNVYLYWEPGATWSFRMQGRAEGRVQVYVDPYRNEILGEDRYKDKFLQWVYDLHVHLLLGELGEFLNGWGGLALALMSVSGLVIWWPGRRWWKQGFVYETRARWKRQNYDLHKVGGFWTLVPLFLLAITGAYWTFPESYEAALEKLFGGPVKIATPRVAPRPETAYRSLDEALAAARAALPEGVPTLFRPAAKANEVHSLHHILPGDWRTQGDNVVYVDPYTAKVVRVTLHKDLPLAARLQRDIFALHFGTFGGHGTRVAWVIFGVAPLVLFVTGLLMWWNRSLSKKPPFRERDHAPRRAPVREEEPVGAARRLAKLG